MNVSIDRHKANQVFAEYADRFDTDIIEIRLKIDHTYRVADISERIAKNIGANPDFAWLLGLLHDIARFEQYTKRIGDRIPMWSNQRQPK